MDAFLIYVTAKDEAEARAIARTVVEERLAACGNLLGAMQSVYQWKGAVCEESEVALLLKTSAARKDALLARVRALHSYETPCVICLPIMDGNPDFLDWIAAETR